MRKVNFNRVRKVAAIAVCLAVTWAGFTSCGDGGDPEQPFASHTADCLALPLEGYTNQEYNHTVDMWDYETTRRRFNLTGTYFIRFGGFQAGRPLNEEWNYYADQVTFTNGNATIRWADIKKIIRNF